MRRLLAALIALALAGEPALAQVARAGASARPAGALAAAALVPVVPQLGALGAHPLAASALPEGPSLPTPSYSLLGASALPVLPEPASPAPEGPVVPSVPRAEAVADGGLAPVPAAAPLPTTLIPSSKRVATLLALLEKDQAAGIKAALEILQDKGERRVEVRISALRALEKLGSPELGPPVLDVLKNDANWYMRREAARMLGARAEALSQLKPAIVAALKLAYKNPTRGLRPTAAWALQRFKEVPGPDMYDLPAKAPDAPAAAPGQPPADGPGRPIEGPKQRITLLTRWLLGPILAFVILSSVLGPGGSLRSPAPVPERPAAVETIQAAPGPVIVPGTAGSEHDQPAAPTIDKRTPEEKKLDEIAASSKRSAEASERTATAMEDLAKNTKPSPYSWVWTVAFLGLLLFGGPMIAGWIQRRRMMGGGMLGGRGMLTGGSGKSQELPKDKVGFSDVAGIDDALVEVHEILDYMRDPSRFQRMGGRAPKGVLLEGPPGTGKTLLARALAMEADAAFHHISGSDFVEMFVGVGASRVRELFAKAKADAEKTGKPVVIFIDEIDAVGKARAGSGKGNFGSNDEREQTINALLAEMDGFESSSNVIVVAATNRLDTLDPALIRPGRFDRKIYVGAPDVLGREAILQIHSAKIRLSPRADLRTVARRTPGLAGADLASIMNEAALLAARFWADAVEPEHLDMAIDKLVIGQQRNNIIPAPLRKRIAYHEAGHTLAGLLVPHPSRPQKVTIIAHGSKALGFTDHGEEDRYLYTQSELEDRLVGLLGGMAAEEMIYDETSTGPGSDLEQAHKIARLMVEKLGMSKVVGLGVAGPDPQSPLGQRNVSEETAREIDVEVKRILDEAKDRTRLVLEANRPALEALVAGLIEKETLTLEEIEDRIRAAGTPLP